MNGSALLLWFLEYIYHYNLFVPEEDDYEDNENDGALRDPTTLVKHQQYATYLYVALLIGKCSKITLKNTRIEDQGACIVITIVLVSFIFSHPLYSFLHRLGHSSQSSDHYISYYSITF